MPKSRCLPFFVLSLFATSPIARAASEPMVVSPADDLHAALVKMRQAERPATLRLSPGRYFLDKTLVLGNADSGLVIESTGPEPAHIVGSKVVTDWKLADAKLGIWEHRYLRTARIVRRETFI